ncbi:protein kinase [Streptomyces sp. NPDC051018]|uniref:protein kinase n=1 Tax=Streptomyces sp. NPDC051018 TaxID=3365639 RepID=UPI0037B0437C
MDDYTGRVLADRYRLPPPPSDAYEFAETRAFDTYSGQEVLVRQVPLPEIIEAEVVDPDGRAGPATPRRGKAGSTPRPTDPAVLRAVEAAQAAAQVPDHPRLDQVFDVFAEEGSLWIVSERVAGRPLAALLAEKPLSPYRAAEVASDVLTALRALHTYGWTHRNITARTVLVCDDGRVVLTGLASGAAEEALCGYAPVPEPQEHHGEFGEPGDFDGQGDATGSADYGDPGAYGEAEGENQDSDGNGGGDGRAGGHRSQRAHPSGDPGRPDHPGHQDPNAVTGSGAPDARAARAGAIAAYRAGARAAARVSEGQRQDMRSGGRQDGPPVQTGHDPDWWARKPGEGPQEPPYAVGSGGNGPGTGPGPYGQGGAEGQDDDDPDGFDDEYGAGGPGRPRLAGAWHDGPLPGQDGPPPLPAGGGFLPAAQPRNPHRDNDPYGVRGALPPGGTASGRGSGVLSGNGPTGTDPSQAGVPPADAPSAGPPGADEHRAGAPRAEAPPISASPGYPPAGGQPGHGRNNRGASPGGGRGPALPAARGGGSGPGSGDPYRPPALPRTTGPRESAAPAPGNWDRGGAGREALRADSQRRPDPAVEQPRAGGWDEAAGAPETPVYRGPTTPLAAERARQARIAVVGAVTERWAPEQAGPVHENWQLAAPVGPATDLWALGALLYRSVQGHAPYPEENAAELVQLVCAEPPAFAEECGPLRPVVESLLRQDPTERPDFEELRGWLRSLVRSAPEPEAGMDVVPLPSSAVDGSRLPVVRRRGELVRRRRSGSAEVVHGRHRHRKAKRRRGPRSLGRTLVLLVLLLMAAAVAYAVLFLPRAGEEDGSAPRSSGGTRPTATGDPAPGQVPDPGRTGTAPEQSSRAPGSRQPQTSAPAGDLPDGFALRSDPEGFRIAVDESWQRRPINDAGQVRYSDGDFILIVVPGRDMVKSAGEDPLDYQRDRERELQPFRASSWATSSGLRRIEVGRQVMAEGEFTWRDSSGREVYVRNRALVIDGRYHVIQVIGPGDRRDEVTQAYDQAVGTYRAAG